MSRLIIEGVDGTGKSTLAKRFVELDYKLIHCRYRPHRSGIMGYYRDLLSSNRGKVVFDRSFISEAVYGPVLRGSSRIKEADFISLCEEYFRENDSMVIYVVEELDTIRRRLSPDVDGEHSAVLRNLPQLFRAYDEAMRIISKIGPVFEISPSRMTSKEADEFVASQSQ